MRIIVLGGDGYLGWPTAMHLSKAGHEVLAVDNYMRRDLCRNYFSEPINATPTLARRAKIWYEATTCTIDIEIGDLSDPVFCDYVFKNYLPDVVIHYAEQPSAPFSMRGEAESRLTLNNNLNVTFNVIQSVHKHCPSCHIVKLGTMGEYGTPNIDIEEGWLEVEKNGRKQKFIYPRAAGSLYHTTKVLDTDLLWFYVRVWGLRVTDLMQGPVYGIETYENEGNQDLYPFFNYDEMWGTVFNRFIVQALTGYPLTVYGKGGQTRGYLNIKDTMQCIKLAVDNPPECGELRIFNQFVETFSVNDIANIIKSSAGRLGLEVEIQHIENPRVESEEHYYNPIHTGLVDLGLKPHFLDNETIDTMMMTIAKFKDRVNSDSIFRNVKWKK